MEALDARAYAILQVVQRACISDIELVRTNTAKEGVHDTPQDRFLNRRTAAEAIELLKNEGNVLPLSKKIIKTLAVIGPNAKTRTVSGGGSAFLTSSYVVTPLEGLKTTVEGTGIELKYSTGCYGELFLLCSPAANPDLPTAAHRYLPMLDGWIKTSSGTAGVRPFVYEPANNEADFFSLSGQCRSTMDPSTTNPSRSTTCFPLGCESTTRSRKVVASWVFTS